MIKLYKAALLAKRKFELRKAKKNIMKRFAKAPTENKLTNNISSHIIENNQIYKPERNINYIKPSAEKIILSQIPSGDKCAAEDMKKALNKNTCAMKQLNNINSSHFISATGKPKAGGFMQMSEAHLPLPVALGKNNSNSKFSANIKENKIKLSNEGECSQKMPPLYKQVNQARNTNSDKFQRFKGENNIVVNADPLLTNGHVCEKNIQLENNINISDEVISERNYIDSPERIGKIY